MNSRPSAVASLRARPNTTGVDSTPSEQPNPSLALPGRVRRGLCIAICAGALLTSPGAALADSIAKEASIGMGTFFATAIYSPVKVVYAVGGLVVGGLAWVFSGGDAEVASVIWTPSLRGSYVLTPKMLTGKDEIAFFGRDPAYRESYATESQPESEPETPTQSEVDGDDYAAAGPRW